MTRRIKVRSGPVSRKITPPASVAVVAGSDTTAIHDNVAGEIDAITEATPESGDWLVGEDTSDGDNKKKFNANSFLGGASAFVSDTVKYTAGNFTLNNTGDMAAVHASGLDLTVAASAGDLIILGVSGLLDRRTANAFTMFDVGTIVSAAIVNRVSGQAASGNGIMGWFIDSDAPEFARLSGGFPYAVVAGDIDSGNVTFRLLYRTNAANNVTLRANSTEPLWVWVYNH